MREQICECFAAFSAGKILPVGRHGENFFEKRLLYLVQSSESEIGANMPIACCRGDSKWLLMLLVMISIDCIKVCAAEAAVKEK